MFQHYNAVAILAVTLRWVRGTRSVIMRGTNYYLLTLRYRSFMPYILHSWRFLYSAIRHRFHGRFMSSMKHKTLNNVRIDTLPISSSNVKCIMKRIKLILHYWFIIVIIFWKTSNWEDVYERNGCLVRVMLILRHNNAL